MITLKIALWPVDRSSPSQSCLCCFSTFFDVKSYKKIVKKIRSRALMKSVEGRVTNVFI